MEKPHSGSLKSEGRAARRRAMERQGSSRISAASWYPEIEAFRERGYKIAWIATACDISERQVRRILREGRDERVALLEMPVEREVREEDKDPLEFSAEGFRKFFNRYSGKKLPKHMREWTAQFIAHRNLVLNVPPRHAKTTWIIWLTAWLLTRNRNEQILIVSKTANHAINITRSISMILELNRDLIETYGRFSPDQQGATKWAPGSGELMIVGRTKETKQGDLSVQSRGMEQQILGMEATVVVCDDITDAKIAVRPDAKVEEMRKFRDEILSRIEPRSVSDAAGRALIVGQRVDAEDLYEDLKDQTWLRGPRKGHPLWTFITMPAVLDWGEYDEQGGEIKPLLTLWPERFDREEIEIEYARFGETTFQTMFQQRPTPRGERLIKEEWIEGCRDYDRAVGQGFKDAPGQQLPIVRVVSIDPSPTEWNVGIVADIFRVQGNWACAIVDLDRWKGRGREFKHYTEKVLEVYRPDYMVVEESTFFSWFTEDVWFEELQRAVKVLKHHTGVNKGDLELGADSLAVDFEMHRISIPSQDEFSRERTQILIDEALAWPRSKTFDAYMALWFIKWNRKKLRPRDGYKSDHFRGSRGDNLNASGRLMKAKRERESKRSRHLRTVVGV